LPARDELDKDLRMIGDEIDRLEQLARKYLDYSRLGEQHLHAEPIGAILASAVSLIAHRIRETGVAVTVQVEPNLPLVRVDAGQIKQVLLNLLGNALDVLPSGGTILLSARPGTGPEGKGQVVVEVRDNGPGIPNEVVGQVFVAFFSTKVGGTGLGLPISAQLAQQNGGRLVLESTSVGGTCFALWLPSTQTDE
jgi:two-component system, NtrC family, sensor histidine kinase HydH